MDGLAFLISGLSFLVALGSLGWAIWSGSLSKKLAEDANKKADTANQLSADANNIAKDSQRIAEESGTVGQKALTIAQRTELRQRDTSNIHWEGDWKQPGIYTLVNLGDDEAFNVRIILTVGEEVVRVREDSIPGGGTVDIECPQAAKTYRRELNAWQAEKLKNERMRQAGYYFAASLEIQQNFHFISERVDWVTESGKPDTHYVEDRLTTLGDFY